MSDISPRPILLIDGLNLFIRCWCAYPAVSTHGGQLGGVVGFLKTLNRLVSENTAQRVIIAWEAGGSRRRRGIDPNYKNQRKPEKLNRFYGDDIPETHENWQSQLTSLVKITECLPVTQVYVEDCEGDDVISYCAASLRGVKKIIVSSDKDFYQLLDGETVQYSPHKKCFITQDDVLRDFSIHPCNFAIAKAICGDPGDNVSGVPRVGFKSLAKHFDILKSNTPLILPDVEAWAAAHRHESAIIKRVWENWDIVQKNWKLVFLGIGALSPQQISKIDYCLATKQTPSQLKYFGLLKEIGTSDIGVHSTFQTLKQIGDN